MDINFPLVMLIAVAVTGAIWLLDIIVLAPRRATALADLQGAGQANEESIQKVTREPVLVEYSKSFFPVLAIVLVLRSFLVEPF